MKNPDISTIMEDHTSLEVFEDLHVMVSFNFSFTVKINFCEANQKKVLQPMTMKDKKKQTQKHYLLTLSHICFDFTIMS